MSMKVDYYFDESGSTGDLINSGNSFDFSQQRIFTLACVGVDDIDRLEHEISRLKALHGIKTLELKSKALRSKPLFVADLVSYFLRRKLPILVEVVEKRYFVCTQMVSYLILPVLGQADLQPVAMFIRKTFATYIHNFLPDDIIQSYVDACTLKTKNATLETYQLLLSWLDTRPGDDVAEGIKRFAEDSYKDLAALSEELDNGWNGLPIPDDSKQGKSFWMLPNLSSFTNLYARLNLLHRGSIGHLNLFHDEQLQFDNIITNAKLDTEEIANKGSVINLPNADYSFCEQAHLSFVNSSNNAGIQAADVIAGFSMRYVQNLLFSSAPPVQVEKDIFKLLLGLNSNRAALGCNLVTSESDFLKIINVK